ncbi:MAG: DUF4127 family protein [Planctomycetes bacterium]|nr:DUF4127 family protein [Planctomycetota bacterium]
MSAQLPAQLAAIAGHEVTVPPRSMLGRYMSPADPAPLLEFLAAHGPKADALVVSVDLLLHGGIEVSRDARLSKPSAHARFDAMAAALAPFGDKTTLFSCITRSTITATREPELALWSDLASLNALRGRILDSELEEQRNLLRARVPASVVASYDFARERNHEIAQRVARLAAERKVARAVFLQDDSGPHGPHVRELEELRALSAGAPVDFMPGTDEAGTLLTASVITQASSWLPRVSFMLSDAPAMGRTALYEHEPFRESLHSHLRPLGILVDNTNPEVQIFLHPPVKNSRDLFLDAEPDAELDLTEFAAKLYESIADEKDTILIDCAHANGADPNLMDSLPPELLGRLTGFAAWNTASNTLGCALAQTAMVAIGKRAGSFSPGANARFTRLRLLDDWLFQTIARRELGKKCKAQHIDRFQFGGDGARLDAELDNRLHELEAEHLSASRLRFAARFPWHRLFECELDWIEAP